MEGFNLNIYLNIHKFKYTYICINAWGDEMRRSQGFL